MKINKNDIDPAIIEKLNQFDSLIENFKDEDRSGFLAYNGEKFYIRRTSDVFLRKISSEEELQRYKDHLYIEEGLLKNSFRSHFNIENKAHSNFKSITAEPKEYQLFKFTSRIVLHKEHDGNLYVLTEKGFLVNYNLKTRLSENSIDLLGYIKSNFAIQSISIYDFIAIEVYEKGLLISTRNNGVFHYTFETKKIEIRFPESDVVLIKYLRDDLFVLGMDKIDNNIAFYNISGMKVEISNSLRKRLFQMPYLIDVYAGNLFILGKPYSIDTVKDTLHYWKKDLADISYNNMDGKLFPGYDVKNYKPKYLTVTDKYVYISGLKENKHLFIWQYDVKELEKPYKEFLFTKFPFEDLNYVNMTESYFIAAEKNNVYFMDANGEIEKNLLLKENVKDIVLSDDEHFFYITDDKIIEVTLPKYENKEISLTVYDDETACNNIDIFVKSTTGKEKIAFFDQDTLTQIAPFFFGVYKNDIIIKLLGVDSKKISMKIHSPNDSYIDGIVVNPNRMFMK
jgi:hypothetical protein